MKRCGFSSQEKQRITELAQLYNTSKRDIMCTMADGYSLDVIADWLANGKNLYDLPEQQ